MRQSGTFHTEDEADGPTAGGSASLLYKVFHASPTPITISRLSDDRVVDVNEEWAAFTGYDIDDAIGRTIDELHLWDDRERYLEIRRDLIELGSVHDEELDVRTKSGALRTVLLSAQLIQVQGEESVLKVMTDITERRRTLQALRESEERFHILADSAPVLIWLADEAGAFTHFNRSWLQYTGAPLEDHVEGQWLEFVHPADRVPCIEAFTEASRLHEPFTREYRLRRRDGVYRWFLDRGVARYQPDGTFAGYVGSCVDMQEQKETERALVEAKEHAEAMSQLKATFLTNITHEIRTPLTVILGFTSILRQGVRSEYHRFINLIERSGRRLLLMLDSMLDLAQLEAGTLEVDQKAHNVADVVEGVAAVVRPVAEEKGLELSVSASDGRFYARVDHAILTRVINNIVDNAIKFTETGSIRIDVMREAGEIRIAIGDTGVGIEDEFLAQVFDPFVQESTGLDRTHQGSGLGLSVSRRLIELMGGTMNLSSKKNEGSVFTIVLPASD
jgi:PAS domain S-box-containing protein